MDNNSYLSPKLRKEVYGKRLERAVSLSPSDASEEDRSVRVAFSSEEPVDRWFGSEVLDHSPGSVRLGRLRDGAAVLVNHETSDQVGVVEDASLGTDRRGRAVVRFGESTRAQEIFRDIQTGIRRHISVGYVVHKMVLTDETDDGPSAYRVTDWEPLEISIVPVPADTSVGVGRAADDVPSEQRGLTPVADAQRENMEDKMSDKETQEAPAVDVRAIEKDARAKARESEVSRVRDLMDLGEKFGQADLARKHINEGLTVDSMRAAILESQGSIIPLNTTPEIGLTENEARSFSFLRAIRAKADPGNLRLQEDAAFEFECSRAVEDMLHKKSRGVFVPDDVLTRDFIAGPGGTGQYLVGTDNAGQSFIDLLRNKMVLMTLGATELTGLVGDVAIPSMTAAHTAYWVNESGSITESKPTMGQHTMTPKTLGALSDISRKLVNQSSPSAEAMVRDDIARVLAIEIDRAGLHGAGSGNEPAGIINTTGIGAVAGGANGLAPTYAHVVNLMREVAVDNGDVSAASYLTSPYLRAKLQQVFANTTGGDTPIWVNNPAVPGEGVLNGTRAFVSNQVSDTLTKGSSVGVCSALFYSGNWADLVIGYWSGLDLMVDPYTGSASGTVRVVGLQDVDIDVRHPQSFAVMADALGA